MDKLFDYKNASKYAYSIANIRFYETKLLTREKILRMVGAESVSECYRTLEEAGYAVNQGTDTDFSPILRDEQDKVLGIIKHLSMDDRLHALFAIRSDFHNLKVAAKEFYTKDDLTKAYQAEGIFPLRMIRSAVMNEEFKELGDGGKVLRDTFDAILNSYEETGAPKMIDIITDQHMYADLLKRANEIGNSFLTRIFVREIDLINIRSFFRLRYLEKKRMDFTEAYIGGGDFHIDFFLKNYEDDFYTLKSLFKGTEFLDLITDGSTYIEEHNSFLRFERLVSEYFIKYVRSAKWISFGLEPIISYYYAKQKELKVVRMILSGKLNEISFDDIKEGVPDEYI